MADGGKRFCANPPVNGGIWKWFYQAAEDLEWRAIGLTHVEYPAGKLFICFFDCYTLDEAKGW